MILGGLQKSRSSVGVFGAPLFSHSLRWRQSRFQLPKHKQSLEVKKEFQGLITSFTEKQIAKRKGESTIDDWAEAMEKKPLKFDGLWGAYYEDRKHLKKRHRRKLKRHRIRKQRREEMALLTVKKRRADCGPLAYAEMVDPNSELSELMESKTRAAQLAATANIAQKRTLKFDSSEIIDGRILYLDDNVIAVNKMAGFVCCPSQHRTATASRKQQAADSSDSEEHDLQAYLRDFIVKDSVLNRNWKQLLLEKYNSAEMADGSGDDNCAEESEEEEDGEDVSGRQRGHLSAAELIQESGSQLKHSRFDKYLNRSLANAKSQELESGRKNESEAKRRRLALSISANADLRSGRLQPYVGSIQRLDKCTSGVVLYARQREATKAYCQMLSGRIAVKKYYLAIVKGVPQWSEHLQRPESVTGSMEHYIAANTVYPCVKVLSVEEFEAMNAKCQSVDRSIGRVLASVSDNCTQQSDGQFVEGSLADASNESASKTAVKRERKLKPKFKYAKLSYRILETFEFKGQMYSMLKVRCHTGRSHQIRAQFAYEKMPIVGDKRYRFREPFVCRSEYREWCEKAYSKARVRRRSFVGGASELIALHSWVLEYTCPLSDKPLTIEAPVPDYWQLKFSHVLMRNVYDHF